ncbi:MAG TPA: hypothetical protein VIT41_07640 [Microlunatus sp.]
MTRSDVIDWLLAGDVAVQFQTNRDLLRRIDRDLQRRIAEEGEGAALLAARGESQHWGLSFYRPKWTCSHYTLLDLKNLGLSPTNSVAREVTRLILEREKGQDGGLNPSPAGKHSDACINGMALNYAAYFGADEDQLSSIIDFLLGQQLDDGGFNCRLNRSGAQHSSVHTTLSVFEGLSQYRRDGYQHRVPELRPVQEGAVEFFLRHRLYRSERSQEPIDQAFTRFHHPARWHFDVLRCLDAFADAGVRYDPRMEDALGILERRRRADGRWVAARAYPGATHLPAPRAGQPSRWVTLIARRVLDAYN